MLATINLLSFPETSKNNHIFIVVEKVVSRI